MPGLNCWKNPEIDKKSELSEEISKSINLIKQYKYCISDLENYISNLKKTIKGNYEEIKNKDEEISKIKGQYNDLS